MKIVTLISFFVTLTIVGCANQGTKNAGTPTEPLAKSSSDSMAKIAGSGTGVLHIKEVTFGADAAIPNAVKNECDLLNKLSAEIKTNAAHQYATILDGSASAPADADADVLDIEIINLIGTGGGAWSGAKSVMINGSLSKHGKVVSNFKAQRYSGGGVFGGYKGTCAILGRCVKTLGKDIAGWLQNPTPNAALGDM
jgi:hypothetical protein